MITQLTVPKNLHEYFLQQTDPTTSPYLPRTKLFADEDNMAITTNLETNMYNYSRYHYVHKPRPRPQHIEP
jgi:hypothetical protein